MKKYTVSGFEVWEYDELDSTNAEAARIPKTDLKDKLVVLTKQQTQGKGQVGNKWESEPEKNISMTVVFCPVRYDAARQFAISMVIALGCRDFVSRYTSGCEIKWPNDVYVKDKKIAGILIEHSVSGPYIGYSLCGIGVNINQREFLSDAPNPVSLYQLTGEELPLPQALEELLGCIGRRYARLDDYLLLEKDYLACLYRREGIHLWEDEEGLFKASVAGVDEYGRFVLRDEAGRFRVYGFKEVAFR